VLNRSNQSQTPSTIDSTVDRCVPSDLTSCICMYIRFRISVKIIARLSKLLIIYSRRPVFMFSIIYDVALRSERSVCHVLLHIDHVIQTPAGH